jgi:hypothetical protein
VARGECDESSIQVWLLAGEVGGGAAPEVEWRGQESGSKVGIVFVFEAYVQVCVQVHVLLGAVGVSR